MACRVMGRALALSGGLCLAALLLAAAPALAETASQTSTAATDEPRISLSIEPEQDYRDAVLQLAMRAVSNRAGDPYFTPGDIATRRQLAVYLARALWLPGSPALFVDVQPADWGYNQIGAVFKAGLMRGSTATTFSPDTPVSRQEAAALVVAAMRYRAAQDGNDPGESLTSYEVQTWLAGFQDRDFVDSLYAEPLAAAYRLGLFEEPAEGWLLPKLGMTHLELMVMLKRGLVEPLSVRADPPSPVAAVEGYPKLAKGSKGTLVMLLQQRLNAMTYVTGEPDGKYSNQTRDAVYAFEKYERLKRTGSVDDPVWEALWAASTPVPVHYGDFGRRVEVDLTRQVMMLIRDNEVFMTVHVSTGRFGTPTGDWRIRTRSHGWRPTSLGPIYSPSYFMPRNAIHGYSPVPIYPASHGCVRTPIWIQDEIVDELEMGELVHVFYNKLKTAD